MIKNIQLRELAAFLVLLVLGSCGGTKPIGAAGNYKEFASGDIHIGYIYNPSFFSITSDAYFADARGLLGEKNANSFYLREGSLVAWRKGYIASVPRTFILGDSTRIGLKYNTERPGNSDNYLLSDIYFTDIILSGTEDKSTSITDVIEPEAFRGKFGDMSYLLPIIFDEQTKSILFLDRKANNVDMGANNSLNLLDMKKGSRARIVPPFGNKQIQAKLNEHKNNFMHPVQMSYRQQEELSETEYNKFIEARGKGRQYDSALSKAPRHTYVFLDILGTQKFIFIEVGSTEYSFVIYDYINNITIDKIVMSVSEKESTVNFNNHFVLKYNDYGPQLGYHNILKRSEYSYDGFSLDLLTNDNKVWLYLSDDRQITFWTLDERGFKNRYKITRDESNSELFDNFPDYALDPSYDKYGSGSPITDQKEIKVANDLLFSTDSYGSALVFNLKKNGIRERKIGSLKIKNDTLLPEEREYLAQFDF